MRIQSARLLSFVALLMAMNWAANGHACMSFLIKAKDGSVCIGRTMEFGVESNWKISVAPRNMEFTSPAPNGKKGLTWKAKYGYVGIVGWGIDTMVADGINEAGLSFGGLWYEPNLQYQEVGPGEENRALAQTLFGPWMLSNFATLDEVRQAVTTIKVFAYVVPTLGSAPPAHCIVSDPSGKSIVIEFGDGNVNVYDNPLGILTNAPNFPWHLNHLRQFIGMSNEGPKPRDMSGMKFIPTGHGLGMIGLPGDLTPPSRFIRLGINTYFADKPENAEQALNVCQHIVNAFCIVKGMVVERSPEGKVVVNESTQFATYRDLNNKVLYFQTYENPDLRKVDLKKLDFTGNKITFISMYGEAQAVKDVTATAK